MNFVLRPRTLLLVLLVLVASQNMGAGCNKRPKLLIDTPTNGEFSTAPTINVTGQVKNTGLTSVLVNGAAGTVVGKTYSATVTLDTVAIVNPIVVVATLPNGNTLKKRITVMAGDSILDGDFSEMGVALRLNDSGLDQVEPAITGLVNLDLATLLPAGTLVIDNFCYLDSFLGCIGRVDVTVSGSPPPSIGSFSIDVDALGPDSVDGDVQLNNLFIRANVDDATGVPLHCEIDINSATTNVDANYGLQPDTVDPSNIDVFQNGLANLSFGGFTDSTDCSGLLGGLVELLIGLFIGDIQDLVKPAIEDFLNTPDGNGNTAIAGAIETALIAIELSGPIGEAIGVSLETPLFDVFEDADGITLDSDARITASLPAAGAPDLLESYHVDEAFPTFGPNAPGGSPYGLALCISTSAFNQLLKAEIESGLLASNLEDVDFLGLLVDLKLIPEIAPVVTGDPGPFGELANMIVPGLRVQMLDASTQNVLLEFVVDTGLGLDIDFVNGELAFGLGALDTGNINIDIVQNPLGANETSLEQLLLLILPSVFPDLAGSLGTFPLPAFLGLQLDLVEVARSGEFMSLYLNLSAAP